MWLITTGKPFSEPSPPLYCVRFFSSFSSGRRQMAVQMFILHPVRVRGFDNHALELLLLDKRPQRAPDGIGSRDCSTLSGPVSPK